MLHVLPAPIHRLALRIGHIVRVRVWRLLGSEIRGCAILAFDAEGRLLLVHHSYHLPNHWLLPGGGLARGEDPAATAARELREETGCTLTDALWFASDLIRHRRWTNRIELVAGNVGQAPPCAIFHCGQRIKPGA